VRLGGHISRARGHNKYYSGNGNEFFLLIGGQSSGDCEDGGAIKKVLVPKVHMV